MKKELLIFVLAFTLLSPVLALNVNIKDSYRPRETAIVEITGLAEPLSSRDIDFYSEHEFIPIDKDLAKIGDKYYLYFQLPIEKRNYTMWLKEAKYYEAGREKGGNLKYNFSIQGNLSSFSIRPGVIITDSDFRIELKGLENVEVTAKFRNKTREVELGEAQQESLQFSTKRIKKFTVSKIELSSPHQEYSVPVAIYKSEENKTEIEEGIKKFKFIEEEMNFSVIKGKEMTFESELMNTGQNVLNITLNLTLGSVKVKPENFRLAPGNIKNISLIVNSQEVGEREGEVVASSRNLTSSISLRLTTYEPSEIDFNETTQTDYNYDQTCSDLRGQFCKSSETCEGEQRWTIDSGEEGPCCVGECKQEEEGGWGNIIGAIVIFIVLAIVGVLIYRRVKSKKTSPKKRLKEKSKQYEKRFKSKSKETRGNLTKE